MTDPNPNSPWDPTAAPPPLPTYPAPSQPSYPPAETYPAAGGYPQTYPPAETYPTQAYQAGQPYPAAQPYQQGPGYPGYPTGGYVAPTSAYQPGYGYPPPMKTNGLAVAALVCALAGLVTCISAPVGAVLGHVARKQIRQNGESGAGMALAGIIVGWVLTGLLVAYIAFVVIGIWWAAGEGAFDDPYAMMGMILTPRAG